MKEEIIETAIQMIDQQGGALGVSLREIARKIGCSAPNIYNYFSNLDDLLNTALIRICEDLKNKVQAKMEMSGSDDLIERAFHAYVEYVVENPGRLNMYHFEKLNFKISPEAEKVAESVGQYIAELIYKSMGGRQPLEKVMAVSGIIHPYMIGAMSDYITGRALVGNKIDYINEYVSLSKRIFMILIQEIDFGGQNE